jgi:RNA polymerase sigma factor (sigma-70 family)
MLRKTLANMSQNELANFCDDIAKCLHSLPDPDDLVSEAIYKGVEAEVEGAEVRNPKNWLRRVATNEGLNRRRHGVIVDGYQEMTARGSACYEPAADNEALRAEACEQIERALKTLRPDCAAVVLLVLDGWTFPEIAKHLGTTVGAIKKLFYDACVILRKVLRAYYED